MKNTVSSLALAFVVFGLLGVSGCKPTCEKAVANLRELAKSDADFQKRIGNEKDEELVGECKKTAEKKPEVVECYVKAKSLDELKKCDG